MNEAPLEKLKKAELIALCQQLRERSKAYDDLVLEKDRLVERTNEVLKKVAKWENNKEIVFADLRSKFQSDRVQLKKTAAQICVFLWELRDALPTDLQVLVAAKIEVIEKRQQIEAITKTQFDATMHVPLSVSGQGTTLTYVTRGYLFQGRVLFPAKVVLS